MQALKKIIFVQTTNLAGLAVAKAPHASLKAAYKRILDIVKMMPETAAYRVHTEKVVSERLALVEKTPNVSDLEKKIDCGQIEEVIVQARNEYELAKNMLKWKPWEPLVQEAPPNQWKWPM
ncbi:NADH dehydrogenase [ubiquinone] 1 alpha subcomplex subunit [Echinococcus granulosus]|uniref:NADH dehydrogenase [ubiquinone] 1 alpha subcomplex subunit n=1 Tax=Echinococcus granulosus TaxID=6210 RepID=W6V5L3_ECHGR|nr:NADH dehydrogenase [ubiquinone] 1 alpha subcomplex subunit [Echinococcus granulosus]EUB61609.1 NADH dehydrogenase [ubiquinone] 1 alpha subcomplex subunit [Echinococcus granulosus]